jgi:transposase
MDTSLVAQQFDGSRRRVQQLAKEYRDAGAIPQVETPGRTPVATYPADLVERILRLQQLLDAGVEAISRVLRVRDDISIATNRVRAILQEYDHGTENPDKLGRKRPWVRFERKYAGVTIHMDWTGTGTTAGITC